MRMIPLILGLACWATACSDSDSNILSSTPSVISDNAQPPVGDVPNSAERLRLEAGTMTLWVPFEVYKEHPDIKIAALGAQAPSEIHQGNGLTLVGDRFEASPHGVNFSQPVRVVIRYADVAEALEQSAQRLVILRAPALGGPWESLDSEVDEAAETVSADVPHFSFFQLGMTHVFELGLGGDLPSSVCGNGVLDALEACDDGDTDNCTTACSADCSGPYAVICGDGIPECGELCDDSNVLGGDGCSATCVVEVCGNGVLDQGEDCEDGNTAAGDGCTESCAIEYCGDGVTQPTEECDDAGVQPGDGCDQNCRIETCGNGILQAGEACDDGNESNNDACLDTCLFNLCNDGFLYEGIETCELGIECEDLITGYRGIAECDPTCQEITGCVPTESCGDGIINGLEACDEGSNNGLCGFCAADCSGIYHPICGDGVVECGEVCDDGYQDDCGSCNSICNGLGAGWLCGDSVVCPEMEVCDTGSNDPVYLGDYRSTSDGAGVRVVVSGDRAFVIGMQSRMAIMDISADTPSIESVFDYYAYGRIFDLHVVNDRLYTVGDGGVQVYDISTNPPISVGSYTSGSMVRAIAIEGNRAYVAAGSDGLLVLDISTDSPQLLGQYSGSIYQVAVSGNRAYVSGDYTSIMESYVFEPLDFHVLDITGNTPVLVGSYFPPAQIKNITLDADRAYLALGWAGMQLLDVSTDTPNLLGTVDVGGDAMDVAVSDGKAYVAIFNLLGVQVVDITNPPFPLVGNSNTLDRVSWSFFVSLDIQGDRAYVLDGGLLWLGCGGMMDMCLSGYPVLHVLEINNCLPGCGSNQICNNGVVEDNEICDDGALCDQPNLCNCNCLGWVPTPVCGNSEVEWGEVCDDGAANGTCGFCGADCSVDYYVCGNGFTECGEVCDDGNTDPCDGCAFNCSYIDNICGDGVMDCGEVCDDGDLSPCGGPCNETCSDHYATACGDGVVDVCEACDDAIAVNPFLIGAYDTPDVSMDIEVRGDYAYVTDRLTGLLILDVRSPNPTYVGEYATARTAWDVEVSGSRAFLAAGSDGLVVVDISNPASPTFLGSDTVVGANFNRLTTDGVNAYVVDNGVGIQVFDVTGPSPTLVGSHITPWTWSVEDVALSENPNQLFFTEFMRGMFTMNVSNPSNPGRNGYYDTPGYAHSITIDGGYAYLSDGTSIQIFEINSAFAFVGSYPFTNTTRNTARFGDYLFVDNHNGAVNEWVQLDISDPTLPVEYNTFTYPPGVTGANMEVAGSRLYQSVGDLGVQVYQLTTETEGSCLIDCSGIQTCGNGVANGSELCDEGPNNGMGPGFCLADCSGIEP